MHFAENPVQSSIFIRAYNTPILKTTQAEFQNSIVLFNNAALSLLPQKFEELHISHLESLAELKPELILFGTGQKQRFIHPSMCEVFYTNHIGLEVMTTDAACRTFNLLLTEDRAVMAALFI